MGVVSVVTAANVGNVTAIAPAVDEASRARAGPSVKGRDVRREIVPSDLDARAAIVTRRATGETTGGRATDRHGRGTNRGVRSLRASAAGALAASGRLRPPGRSDRCIVPRRPRPVRSPSAYAPVECIAAP